MSFGDDALEPALPDAMPLQEIAAKEIAAQNEELLREASEALYQPMDNDSSGKPAELKDFEIKFMIGQGSFGKVFLVQHKVTLAVYAMKTLAKSVILEYDQVEATLLEKEILEKCKHPFLVGMEYVFQTEQKLFFVMRFVRGGELFMHLQKQKKFSE